MTGSCERATSLGSTSPSLSRNRARPTSTPGLLYAGMEAAATTAPASRSTGSSSPAIEVRIMRAYRFIASSNTASRRSSLLSKYW